MLNIERLIRPENNIFHTIKSYNNLPRRNDRKQTKTSWVDQVDIRYTYDIEKKDTLVICSPLGFYPDSIMDYINNLPEEIKVVVLKIDCKDTGTAGINMLMDLLRRVRPKKNIILPVGNYQMGEDTAFEYYRLPNNVKITNTFSSSKSTDDKYYGENPFDWWLLHLNDQQFNNIVSKMTRTSATRARELRSIAKEYYCRVKLSNQDYDRLPDLVKANDAYEFVKRITRYDTSSTTRNVTTGVTIPKPGCEKSSDPIETFKERKGVCTGRSRLLKAILNNSYMKVKCFLVGGTVASGSNHEWVEVIADNERYYYDLSFGLKARKTIPYTNVDHNDAEASGIVTQQRRMPHKTERNETTNNGGAYQKRRMPQRNN